VRWLPMRAAVPRKLRLNFARMSVGDGRENRGRTLAIASGDTILLRAASNPGGSNQVALAIHMRREPAIVHMCATAAPRTRKSVVGQFGSCMPCGAGNSARSRLSAGSSRLKGGCGQNWPPHKTKLTHYSEIRGCGNRGPRNHLTSGSGRAYSYQNCTRMNK